MPRGAIIVVPNDARDRILLRMIVNGSLPVTAELEAAQADELAGKFERARAALHDKLVSDQGPLTVLEFAAVNPSWRANPHITLRGSEADSVMLGLKHPVYGWLSFVLPDEEARALGEWLTGTASAK